MVDVVGIFQHKRRAAAQCLQRAQERQGAPFVGRHLGSGIGEGHR